MLIGDVLPLSQIDPASERLAHAEAVRVSDSPHRTRPSHFADPTAIQPPDPVADPPSGNRRRPDGVSPFARFEDDRFSPVTDHVVRSAQFTEVLQMTRPTAPTAGWYADPNGGDGLRYWDGAGWTADTQVPPPAADGQSGGNAPYGHPGSAAYAPPGVPAYAQPSLPTDGQPGGFSGGHRPATPGAAAGNPFALSRYALITAAVCVVYAVIATYSSYAFFGVLPVLFTVRSFRAKEPLALLAAALTVATILYSIYRINH